MNEEAYREILDNSNDYIYRIVFRNDRITGFYNNANAETLFECRVDGINLPEIWFEYVYEKDVKYVRNFISDLCIKHMPHQINHKIVTVNGKIKTVSNFCRPVFDPDSGITVLYGYMTDITERTETIRQLRTLSRAVEQSPASVIITDVQGNIEYVNPKFTQLTGYTLPEVIGKNPRILKSGDMDDAAYSIMWKTILDGNDWSGEFHNRKKNGELYWELASISPVRDGNGNVKNFLAVKEDITALKKIENMLRTSQTELQKKNDAYEKELHYAQQVQKALLPLFPPENEHVLTRYRFKSLDAIGGDYFSFFTSDEDISVFTGDVAGHGVSAALFIALLKYISENISVIHFYSPGKYLTELNSILNMAMVDNFITAVYACFKTAPDGVEFYYANGGHPSIILCSRSSKSIQTLKVKGTILGMFPGKEYPDKMIKLTAGDRIFIYTDGLPETRSRFNEIIGYDEITDVIMQSSSDTLDDTLDNIMKRLDDFRDGAVPEDDILIIGFEIK
ncbi:MAG: SpoIIE family protein phosphatase [Spirochaetes bacterium]|nr:SpoIIE family protein phosphatase [Spirochaetota bacterium]